MIRLTRTMGHCGSCAPTTASWPAPVVLMPTLIIRIAAATGTGSGGTFDSCEHHARRAVHSPEFDDGRCTSCGHKGAVQVVGATTVGTRTRYALSLCRARCAAHLAEQIGIAVSLAEGEATEWTEQYEPPPWFAASQEIANRKAGRR